MDQKLLDFLCARREKEVFLSGQKLTMKLLPARQMLQIRRLERQLEAENEEERALFCEAELLARSLFTENGPAFESGSQLLDLCSLKEIQELMEQYTQLDKSSNTGVQSGAEEIEALKKA